MIFMALCDVFEKHTYVQCKNTIPPLYRLFQIQHYFLVLASPLLV